MIRQGVVSFVAAALAIVFIMMVSGVIYAHL
jgi:hypothetical protein